MSNAFAHTTYLGYVPGAGNGQVTFWAGHYSHGDVPGDEGTGTLTGVSLSYNPKNGDYPVAQCIN